MRHVPQNVTARKSPFDVTLHIILPREHLIMRLQKLPKKVSLVSLSATSPNRKRTPKYCVFVFGLFGFRSRDFWHFLAFGGSQPWDIEWDSCPTIKIAEISLWCLLESREWDSSALCRLVSQMSHSASDREASAMHDLGSPENLCVASLTVVRYREGALRKRIEQLSK